MSRNRFVAALLAATTMLVPAAASAQNARQEARAERRAERIAERRAERAPQAGQGRQQLADPRRTEGGRRGDGGQRAERRDDRREARALGYPQRQEGAWQRQGGAQRGDWDRSRFEGRLDNRQPAWTQSRFDDRALRGRGDWRERDARGWSGRDWQRRDWQRRDWNGGNRWSRDWRRDARYDWNRYRTVNRYAYRLPRYYAPYGWNGGYRRFGIGASIGAGLFAPDYWINDPWAYRLPPADGPYRWVRYYDDALLVDLYSGEVVDAIHGIFW